MVSMDSDQPHAHQLPGCHDVASISAVVARPLQPAAVQSCSACVRVWSTTSVAMNAVVCVLVCLALAVVVPSARANKTRRRVVHITTLCASVPLVGGCELWSPRWGTHNHRVIYLQIANTPSTRSQPFLSDFHEVSVRDQDHTSTAVPETTGNTLARPRPRIPIPILHSL